MGLSALITIAIARIAGAQSVGTYALLVLFASFSVVFIRGTVGAVLFRQLARSRSDEDHAQALGLLRFSYRCLAYTLPLAIVFSGLLIFRLKMPQHEPAWLFFLAAVAIMVFESWAAIQLSALRGANRSLTAQTIEGVVRPSCLLLGIAIALIAFGAEMPLTALCLGYLAGLVATRMAGSYFMRRAIGAMPPSTIGFRDFARDYGSQALFFFGSSFTATVIASFDIAISALLLSVTDLGLYKIVLQLSIVANALFVGLNFHVSREFAAFRHVASADREVERRAQYFAWLCVLFALAVTAFLILFGDRAVSILFDVAPAPSWHLFAVVGASFVVNGAFGMASSFLMMNHDERYVFKWSILSIVVAMPVGYLLVTLFDVFGVGAAQLFITLLWNAGLAWRCRRKFGFNPTIFSLRRADDHP